MKDYQYEFIKYALNKKALKFGKFILKSGRISPYFFNIGEFNDGLDLIFLGRIYATVLINNIKDFDVLFGPSYKGIPISIITTAILAQYYKKYVSYSFNRKENKNYGEGNLIIGSKLKGKIVLIDDVITAGTAIHESMKIISHYQNIFIGIIVALDRQEIGYGTSSSVQEIIKYYNCPVFSIININHVIEYLKEKKITNYLSNMCTYMKQYGVQQNNKF